MVQCVPRLKKELLLFSCSVVPDSLWPHGLQHARLPCPSLFPRVCSNSCPLSWWYHPTISSSVVPFSSCIQSFPASGSFPMNRLFASCGQSIGALASILPMNVQGWFLLGLTGINPLGLISLHSPRDSQESSPAPQLESINSLALSLLLRSSSQEGDSYSIWRKVRCDWSHAPRIKGKQLK